MRLAVRGMLPRNKLRDRLMKQRLLLYEVRHPVAPAPPGTHRRGTLITES